MQDQEKIQQEVTQLASKINDNLTEGLVRDGQSYSSCFPSETSYCAGVDRALEEFLEQLFEKYTLTPKN